MRLGKWPRPHGANIARRLTRGGHEVVAFNRDPAAVTQLAGEGAIGANLLEMSSPNLTAPRIFWGPLSAGAPTQDTVDKLRNCRSPATSSSMAATASTKTTSNAVLRQGTSGFHYIDVGTSGGYGAQTRLLHDDRRRQGDRRSADPIFDTLAPGYGLIVRALDATRPTVAPPSAAISALAQPALGISSRWSTTDRIWPDAGSCRGLRHSSRQVLRTARA